MLRSLRTIGVASLLAAVPVTAVAETWVACSLPLPPQTMPDAEGRPSGIATTILADVAVQLGWELDIRYMPWLRVVEEAKAGHCDIVYTVLPRDDYAEFLQFPQEPLFEQHNVFAVRAGRSIRYDGNLEAFLRQHVVGMYRDKNVSPEFDRLRGSSWMRIDEAADATQNLVKLLAGRFDVVIENERTLVYELERMGRLDDVQILAPPLSMSAAYVVFPKSGRLHERTAEFDRELRLHKQTDAYRRVVSLVVPPVGD